MTHETQSPKSFQRGRHLAKKKVDADGKPIDSPFDKMNAELFANTELYLHPTKGYRRASTVGTVCSDIVTGIKRGRRIPLETQAHEVRLASQAQYQNKQLFNQLRRTSP